MRLQAISVIAARLAQFQMELGTALVTIAQRPFAMNLCAVLNLSPLDPSPVQYPVYAMVDSQRDELGDMDKRWFGPLGTRSFDPARDSDCLSRSSHQSLSSRPTGISPSGNC